MIYYEDELYVPIRSVQEFNNIDRTLAQKLTVRNYPIIKNRYTLNVLQDFITEYERLQRTPAGHYVKYSTGRSPFKFGINSSSIYEHTTQTPLTYWAIPATKYNTLLYLYNHYRLFLAKPVPKPNNVVTKIRESIHSFTSFLDYLEVDPNLNKGVLFVDSILYKAKTPYKSLRKELFSQFSNTEIIEIENLGSKMESHIDFEFKYKANDIFSIEQEREEVLSELNSFVKTKLIHTDNLIQIEDELLRKKSSEFFPHKGVLQQFIQSQRSLGEDAGR